MRELHWGATPASSRTFTPVVTPELATMATLETKLTMPGGDGGADEAIQPATAYSASHVVGIPCAAANDLRTAGLEAGGGACWLTTRVVEVKLEVLFWYARYTRKGLSELTRVGLFF